MLESGRIYGFIRLFDETLIGGLSDNARRISSSWAENMTANSVPDWIVVPKRYRLVNYGKRWYDLESSLFFCLEFGKFPDLGPGFRFESMGWGTGSYRIYKTSKLPISAINDIEPELIHVPASEYLMDDITDGGSYRDPRKKTKVHLNEYWIGRMPVTIRQFSYFVNNYGYRTTDEVYRTDSFIWSSPNGKDEEIETNPNGQVLFVSLRDIEAYCIWLGAVTGKKYRLPSLAEWENACYEFGKQKIFQQGEYSEWTSDYKDAVLGYDPECSGEPIYYKNKRMNYICGGTRSIDSRSASFSASKIGFRIVSQ